MVTLHIYEKTTDGSELIVDSIVRDSKTACRKVASIHYAFGCFVWKWGRTMFNKPQRDGVH